YLKDHLGSITAQINGDPNPAVLPNGTTNPQAGRYAIQYLSYDIWGKQRYPNGTADPTGQLNNPDMYHGYTGHEMLDDVGLIHMNGRLYDPVMARFVSADPMVEAINNLQSLNRYSYIWNNPLAFSDPSGYCFLGCFWQPKNWENTVKVVAIAAAAYYTGGLVSSWAFSSMAGSAAASAVAAGTTLTSIQVGAMYGASMALGGAAAGFTGGLLMSGGNLDYAFQSAIAGGLTSGLSSFGGAMFGVAGNIVGQGVGSGISAQMFGGDFTIGLKYGLLGALRSNAFQLMQISTDALASKAWGGEARTDLLGRIWTYGGRKCGKGGAGQCDSLFNRLGLLMRSEATAGDNTWDSQPLSGFGINTKLGEMPLVGAFANSISKVHDWMNNTLSMGTLYGTTGVATDYGFWGNTAMDFVSTAGMIPAAQFTAKALWQPPLKGR
ncbi:MAG: RHS repeat-associated core domain-containing protein, partial [Nitrosomonadales bacterium]|nr:RHS repeat-associated core domain-containing protein [Nitrosomonadales bacterium]